MDFLKKALTYLYSSYVNDWRHNNNISTHLKLIFERNNKAPHSIFSIGNIFCGSKWSDLRTANTKPALTSQYREFLLCSIVFFFFLLSLGIVYNERIALGYWSFCELLSGFSENLFFSIGLFFFHMRSYVINRLLLTEWKFLKSIALEVSSRSVLDGGLQAPQPTLTPPSGDKLGFPTKYWYGRVLCSSIDLLQTNDSISHRSIIEGFSSSLGGSERLVVLGNCYYTNALITLSTLYKQSLSPKHKLSYSLSCSTGYTPVSVVGLGISNTHYPILMLSDVNLCSAVDQSYHTLMLDAMNSLGEAKQVRWLTKNNYLDTDLSYNNNLYIASKSFTNFSSTDLDKSDSNLWQSALFSGNNLDISANSPTSIGLNFQDFSRSYNFFEEGREFFGGRALWLAPQYNTSFYHNYGTSLGANTWLTPIYDYSGIFSKTRTVILGYQKLSHSYPNFIPHNLIATHHILPSVSNFKYSNNAHDSGVKSPDNLSYLYLISSTPSKGSTESSSNTNGL